MNCTRTLIPIGLCAAGVCSASAGLVDLEFRPAAQTVNVGDTVALGLYAVSTDNQPMSAVDMVFNWDTSYLQFAGLTQVGADPNVASAFLPAGDPYGQNEAPTPADGDGLVSVFSAFPAPGSDSPLRATAAGTLLTTLEFTALNLTPIALPTLVDMILLGGAVDDPTRVFDGTSGNSNQIITGGLSGAEVTIVPEPGSVALFVLAGMSIWRRRA